MMDKNYDHKKFESEIYKKWEDVGAFKPNDNKKAFSIIMPPPNANGALHLGHVTFIAVSDTLIRYHRMLGEAALWLPGIDHAGILSQVTFEKKLKKEQDKSRYDLGREEFHNRLYAFCMECKSSMESQMKSLGSSCDWSREKFTLDPEVSKIVLETFIKMHQDGLVYRGYRVVNWCPRCRTTLSDLETEEAEQTDRLYTLDYGSLNVATTRPETIFADAAIAINPSDSRLNKLLGSKAAVPLVGRQIEIVGDESVDITFGTGALKVTPGHDMTDFEIGQRHNLETITIIGFDGKMTGNIPNEIKGLKVADARLKTVELLEKANKIVKIESIRHSVKSCERCNTIIEPLISRQWFVKIKSLAEPAIKAVQKGHTKIIPEKYEKMYFNWMTNIRDWPISRQIWWGHQMPVWYAKSRQKSPEQLKEFKLLVANDSRARTDVLDSPIISITKPSGDDEFVQDPDTFDTWFSSGQWPITTLKTGHPNDFERFYPTAIMNTAYEILFLWVARMLMFGLYTTNQVPFRIALINGVLRDETGAKMSKSKGNGVNPNDSINNHGADAVRFALLAGRDNGNDLLISKNQMEQRIKGYRNFSNKIWNAARFVANFTKESEFNVDFDNWYNQIIPVINDHLDNLRLGQAAEFLYEKFWHDFCDTYIEEAKQEKIGASQMFQTLKGLLKLLHPFMPFVTEAVWQEMRLSDTMLIQETWPTCPKKPLS